MNSFWILWIGRLRGARSVSSFCDFRKMTFRDQTVFSHFEARISCVFLIFLLRSIKAYLCPNMIKFDAVDFSEHRPEEVISFFWRSVYDKNGCNLSWSICELQCLCSPTCLDFESYPIHHIYLQALWCLFIYNELQFTLPKSKSQESNNRLSRRSISTPLFFTSIVLDPT